MNEYKNKTDDELVSNAWKTTNGRTASVEMMRRLKNSINFSSWVMIVLTIFLVIFTAILIWQGFK